MTESGEHLGAVRIMNDPYVLAAVMAQAGEHPEVVLEAIYGWYWAADLLSGWAPRCTWRIRWGWRGSRIGG
jgi:hypothetical protein